MKASWRTDLNAAPLGVRCLVTALGLRGKPLVYAARLSGYGWNSGNHWLTGVVAWMPCPEPYAPSSAAMSGRHAPGSHEFDRFGDEYACFKCGQVAIGGESVAGQDCPGSPYTGTRCSVCREPQFTTACGDTCINSHGGAEPLAEGPTR